MTKERAFTDICVLGYETIDKYSWGYLPLDGDLSKTRAIDQTIVHAKMNSFDVVKPPEGQIDWGRRIHPDHMPTKIRVGGPRRKLGDCIHWRGVALVNDKFRQVVEALEPGVHQFFPVEMQFKSSVLDEPYYFFIICQLREVVSDEHSLASRLVLYGPGDLRPLEKGKRLPDGALPGMWDINSVPSAKRTRALVFDPSMRGGLHFWLDLSSLMKFCSGEAAEAFVDAGVTGVKPIPREMV